MHFGKARIRVTAGSDPGGTRAKRDSCKTLFDVHKTVGRVPKPRMMEDYAALCNVRVKVLKPPLSSELDVVRPRVLLASSATPGTKVHKRCNCCWELTEHFVFI